MSDTLQPLLLFFNREKTPARNMSLFTGQAQCLNNERLVSKETVVLHWWGCGTNSSVKKKMKLTFQALGFRQSEYSLPICSDDGRTLKTSASLSLHSGNLTFTNLFDAKF